MISIEQLVLAEKIKAVHLNLRKRTAEVGAQEAWEEHLKNASTLQQYAEAMKLLAEEHWDKNNQGDRLGFCRIEWITNAIQEYFNGGGYTRQIKKETKKFQDKILDIPSDSYYYGDRLKLLDVGSCYNPFKKFDFLETYALDLCPASLEVMKCNFLDVSISDKEMESWWVSPVLSLPRDYFDVVVFCLFLEYLPCPRQRLKACRIAFDVVKNSGLLVIVTPDSKHQSANAKLMKSWKIALAGLGFVRVRIEKLRYLYCMTFRKTYCQFYKDLPEYRGWEKVELAIPQDYVDYSVIGNDVTDKGLIKNKMPDEDVAETFVELPGDM